MVYIFLADGFEESEAILPADILKRAGLDVCLVSITADKLGRFEPRLPDYGRCRIF